MKNKNHDNKEIGQSYQDMESISEGLTKANEIIMDENKQFRQWEGEIFGAGYGTGELPILKAVKIFFDLLDDTAYDHKILTEKLGETITWLIINAFDKGDLIEWGTSARYGWLTSSGKFVKMFIDGKSPEILYKILMSDNNDLCCCNGESGEGHENCGKNPMTNIKYADSLIYKSK